MLNSVSFILFLTGLEYKRSTLKYGSVSEFWDWHITLMKNNMDSVVFDKAYFRSPHNNTSNIQKKCQNMPGLSHCTI